MADMISDFINVLRLKGQLEIEAGSRDLEEGFGDLFSKIKNINNLEERNNLFNIFIEVRKKRLMEEVLNGTEAYDSIMRIRNDLNTYSGLSDSEIDELFLRHDFNVDSLSKYSHTDVNNEISEVLEDVHDEVIEEVVEDEVIEDTMEDNHNMEMGSVLEDSNDELVQVTEEALQETSVSVDEVIEDNNTEEEVLEFVEDELDEEIDEDINDRDTSIGGVVVDNKEVLDNNSEGLVDNTENKEIVMDKREGIDFGLELIDNKINDLVSKLDLSSDVTLEEIDEEIKKLSFDNSSDVVDGLENNIDLDELHRLEDSLEEKRHELEVYDSQVRDVLNSEIESLTNEISSLESSLNELNNSELKIVSIEDKELVQQELNSKRVELDNYRKELEENNIGYTEQYLDSNYQRLETEIVELENRLNNPRITVMVDYLEETKKIKLELEKKQEELKACEDELIANGFGYGSFQMDENYRRLHDEIEILEDNLNKSMVINTNAVYEDRELVQQELDNKKDELNNYRKELEEKNISYTEQYLDSNYQRLEDEIANLEDRLNNPRIVGTTDLLDRVNSIKKELESKKSNLEEKKDIENFLNKDNRHCELVDEISNLESEINNLHGVQKGSNNVYLLEDKQLSKGNNERIADLNRLKNLIDMRNTYLNNRDKIKKEKIASDEVDNVLADDGVKKIEEKHQDKKLLYKGLAAVAGFGAGLALSSVPGIGTIRMGIAATKLGVSVINVVADKYPESSIGRIRQGIKNSVNDKLGPDFVNKISAVKNKLKQSPLNYFINGVSAGYLVGNVVESFTGESIWEHIHGDKATAEVDRFVPSAGGYDEIGDTGAKVDVVNESVDTIVANNSEVLLNKGDVVDLSALSRGMISSDATEAVKLMQGAGREVVFDKAVKLPNGKVMWHFKQLTGEGYAWFDAKDVQAVLGKVVDSASKTL